MRLLASPTTARQASRMARPHTHQAAAALASTLRWVTPAPGKWVNDGVLTVLGDTTGHVGAKDWKHDDVLTLRAEH